jgi:K+-sensing histidine kinase KdpD
LEADLYLLSSVLAATLNILLGFLVLFRNKKSSVNISFFLMTSFISFWIVALYLSDNVSNIGFGTISLKAVEIFGAWLAYFFLVFTLNFPREFFRNIKNITWGLLTLPIITTILILFTDSIISNVEIVNSAAIPVFGPLGGLFFFGYLLGMLLLGLTIVFYKYNKSQGIQKVQLKFTGFGLLLTAFFIFLFSIILPNIFGIWNVTSLASLATIFFIGFTSYAIVKHRLMDIRMVVARSVAYSLLLLTLAGFYAGSVLGLQALFFPQASADFSFAEGVMRTVIAVIMVFLFQPLRRWITKATDRIFFKEQYNMEELLDKVAHTVSSTIIMIEMIYKTLDLLVSQIRITRGMIIVFSDNNTVLDSQAIGYKEMPKLVTKEVLSLARGGVLVADELSENSKRKQILAKYDASVAIPLKADSGATGLILFGEKQSGDMYSANDLKVFEIIGPEIAVAITNAKSYEKIEKFNITLRQEIKKAIAELEKKNEQLRELDKAKDEFISMASHQLRTPLTAIKGYLSMLLEGDAGEIKVSQYDFVNEAFQGANRMVGLINDLLNVSRMETGRFFLEPREVDMERVVNEEVGQLNKQVKEKGLVMEIKIKGKMPKIWCDETKVRQVVMNFADNAVYYTTAGKVTVTLEKDDKNIIYKVKDTGIGVPKAQQKNMFEKFFRADNARHVRPDGTGLGIYLAKKVIDDHGGKLLFESKEGKGSTFGFTLPIKSKLKMKRVSAPIPEPHVTRPEIGELAAGIGISPTTLEATQVENGNKS